jgi:dephospho-CoA kinase
LLKVGLTGGIASGKSVVGEMFASLGAHLIQADLIAHELMQPGQDVYNEVVRCFGKEILNPDGSVSRPRLAEAAFGHAGGHSRIGELNQIVHPAVIRRQDEWMEEVGRRDPHAIAMVEAALIIEAGAATHFDRLIVVTCSEEQRVQRFAQRLKLDLEAARREVLRRMAAQLPDCEKVQKADHVIDNSGPLDATEARVRQVYALLKSEAGSRGIYDKSS